MSFSNDRSHVRPSSSSRNRSNNKRETGAYHEHICNMLKSEEQSCLFFFLNYLLAQKDPVSSAFLFAF